MTPEEKNRIIVSLLHDGYAKHIVMLRKSFLQQDDSTAIRTLADSIRQNKGIYANLTDDILLQLISEIRNKYQDVANITLDDWENQNIICRLVELHEYVRDYIANRLNVEHRKVNWSIVGKIISSVFGNAPVITNSVRKTLKEANILQHQYTNDIYTLLFSVRELWLRYRYYIAEIVGELAIRTAFDLGMNIPSDQIVICLVPHLLIKVFNMILEQQNMHNERNNNQPLK